MNLTKAMLQQMRAYAEEREGTWWYYSNKRQCDSRHVKILAWLDAQIAAMEVSERLKDKTTAK